MIELSNKHRFEYVAASGALGPDGRGWPWEQPYKWVGLLEERLFTTVLKTITLPPTVGNYKWYNPLGTIRLIEDGCVNAYGLTNPGAEWWSRTIGPSISSKRAPVVGSILGEPEELGEMAQMFNEVDVVGVEVNASCPNTGDDMLSNTGKVVRCYEAVKSVSRHPVWLKISAAHDYKEIIRNVDPEVLDINSVPYWMAFPGRTSPLARFGGGGVSGKAAQAHNWALVEALVGMTDIQVIGPSVWDYEDIAELRRLKAKAISFGGIFLRYPWRPTLYVRRDLRERAGKAG